MKQSLLVRMFLVVMLLLLLIACERNDSSEGKVEPMSNNIYKIPESCNFDEIDHAFSSNSCSPQIIKPSFEGVLINAPKRVVFSEQMEVLIACSFSFSNKTELGIFNNIRNAIVFTVVDTSSHIPYSGKVRGVENSIPPPKLPNHAGNQVKVNPEEIPLQFHEGYVNMNLLEVVRMPNRIGKYILYATVSTYKSNVLEFEIVNPEGLGKN